MRLINAKTILLTVCLAAIFPGRSRAQQVYEISAPEAVKLAFDNVASLKNARLDYKIAEARNNEIVGLALPQINGVLNGTHYLSLPQIQFPDATEQAVYDVLRDEGVKDGSGNPITKDGELTFRNFSFFTPWNLNGGLTVQQLLFEPQVFVGLEARKALIEGSGLQVKMEEDKVKETVYKSYYSVLISRKQLEFVSANIKRLERLAFETGQLYKNGFAEKLDVDRTAVSLNNLKTAESQLHRALIIGEAMLKLNLGVSQADSLVLKDSLTTDFIKQDVLDETFTYDDRNEVKLLNNAIRLQGYDIRRHRLSYAPTLAAFYNFQRTGQRNAMGNDNSPWFWYNTNQVGLSVNIPIFDGLQKKNRILQAKFTQEKTMNTLEQLKKGIDLEIISARNVMYNAFLAMDAQEENMKLAEEVFNTVKKKYQVGLGTSFETIQADTELQQAQSNYFKSLYDAIIAKIDFLKAMGKL